MSETLTPTPINPNQLQIDPDMRGPVTPGQELQAPSGTGWPEADGTVATPEQTAPVTAEATQTVLPEQTALNPDRASVQLTTRIANFMNRRAESMANRRTTKQVASEKYNDGKDAAKATATKVGNATLTAGVLSVNKGLEVAGKATDKIAEKRAAAQTRKEARIAARAEKREARQEAKQNAKNVKEYRKDKTDMYKGMFDEIKAADKLESDAWKANAKFDRKQDRAEKRAELSEKAKKASKVIGKVAVVAGVGLAAAPAVIPAAVAYGGYKGAKFGAEKTANGVRKTVEVIGDAGDATVVKVRRGQQAASEAIVNARVTRLDSKYTKAEAKQKKYQEKIKKIVNS